MVQYKTAPAMMTNALIVIPRSPTSSTRMHLKQLTDKLFELPQELE
jgi:hypothetical protein